MSSLCFSATDCVSDVGPASVIVGNLVQGNRLASAQGRDVGGVVEEDGDSSKKVRNLLFDDMVLKKLYIILYRVSHCLTGKQLLRKKDTLLVLENPGFMGFTSLKKVIRGATFKSSIFTCF